MAAPVPGTGCHPALGALAAVTTLGQFCISGGICAPFSGVSYSTPDSFSAPHASFACLSFSSVQLLLIGVRLLATPWTAAHQASLSITNSRSLLKLMCIMMVHDGDAVQPSHPLSSPSPPAFNFSQLSWIFNVLFPGRSE